LGIGFIIGEPTGLTTKLKTSERNSLKFSAAWSLGNYFHFHSDLLHITHHKGTGYMKFLRFYTGFGGRILLKKRDNPHLGIRIPFGIIYKASAMEPFFEIVPVMEIFPKTILDFDLAIGFHFYPP
jgi:hypothetical protein